MNLLPLAARNAASNKARLVLTVLAVTIGVAFVTGSFVLTDNLRAGFNSLVDEGTGITDLTVLYSTGEVDATAVAPPGPISGELYERVAAVEGVERAFGEVQGIGALIGPDGSPVTSGGPHLVFSHHPYDGNPFRVTAGREPVGRAEVMLDERAADLAEVGLGDRVTVGLPPGAVEAEVVGLVRYGEDNNLMSALAILFDPAVAAEVLGWPGRFDSISVLVADGADVALVQERIAALLPANLEVLDRDALREQTKSSIGEIFDIFARVLLGFACVTLLVAILLVANTFSIVVAQRLRELALLRAIGAEASQVFLLVMIEAAAIGVVASLLGMLGGVLIARAMQALFNAMGLNFADNIVLAPRTIAIAVGVGLVITLVSALVPAYRATRVPPLAALREESGAPGRARRRVPAALGGAVLAVGMVLMAWGVLAEGLRSWALIGALGGGAVAVFLGVAALSRYIAAPAVRILGGPLAGVTRLVGGLARQNAARNPRRTSATAAALMVGLAMVAAFQVVGSSIRTTIDLEIDQGQRMDFMLMAPNGMVGMDLAVAEEVAALPGVDAASGFVFIQTKVDGVDKNVTALDPAVTDRLADVDLLAGALPASADEALVFTDFARDLDKEVGDEVTVAFSDGDRSFRISGIHGNDRLVDQVMVPLEAAAATPEGRTAMAVFVAAAPGADPEALRPELERAMAAYPQVEVQNREEVRDSIRGQLDPIFVIVNGLLGFSIVVAGLGILNTTAIAVLERTREIGLLRALGAERRTVRRMIRWEAVLVALFGGLLGALTGAGLGVAAALALPDTLVATVTIPIGGLAFWVAVAVGVGVLAALWPAWRASRMDVLRAIATAG